MIVKMSAVELVVEAFRTRFEDLERTVSDQAKTIQNLNADLRDLRKSENDAWRRVKEIRDELEPKEVTS